MRKRGIFVTFGASAIFSRSDVTGVENLFLVNMASATRRIVCSFRQHKLFYLVIYLYFLSSSYNVILRLNSFVIDPRNLDCNTMPLHCLSLTLDLAVTLNKFTH